MVAVTGGTEPPFRSIGIVGLGLIGGSIASGVRRAWPATVVIGVDQPDVAVAARTLGITTESRGAIEELQDVDLLVLAAPVPEILRLIGAAAAAGLHTLVTDVGSTKRHIMSAAAAASLRFVGGHPVAGAAQAGLAHARADLFEGREWLLVSNGASDEDVLRLECLVRGLRAVPRRIDAETHDRVMAYVSHLPQLLSTALMSAAGEAVGSDGLAAAGPGFGDMTRLASSTPDIWRGILSSNADFVTEALRDFVAALPDAAELSDPVRIDRLFARANEWAGKKK